MTTTRRIVTCAMFIALGGALAAAEPQRTAPQDDPVIGVWQLDLAKSHYVPGPAPMREVRTYEYEHEGIKATIVTTDNNGRNAEVEYVASYNDVVALVTGSDRIDAIKLRKINDTTAEATLSYQGRSVGTARRVIARDGRSMTITFRRDEPTPINNLAVYTKVVPATQ